MLTSLLLLSLFPLITIATHSTAIALTDVELIELLQIVFNTIGSSTFIPINLLIELGLNTLSVITFLQNLGYTILW